MVPVVDMILDIAVGDTMPNSSLSPPHTTYFYTCLTTLGSSSTPHTHSWDDLCCYYRTPHIHAPTHFPHVCPHGHTLPDLPCHVYLPAMDIVPTCQLCTGGTAFTFAPTFCAPTCPRFPFPPPHPTPPNRLLAGRHNQPCVHICTLRDCHAFACAACPFPCATHPAIVLCHPAIPIAARFAGGFTVATYLPYSVQQRCLTCALWTPRCAPPFYFAAFMHAQTRDAAFGRVPRLRGAAPRLKELTHTLRMHWDNDGITGISADAYPRFHQRVHLSHAVFVAAACQTSGIPNRKLLPALFFRLPPF